MARQASLPRWMLSPSCCFDGRLVRAVLDPAPRVPQRRAGRDRRAKHPHGLLQLQGACGSQPQPACLYPAPHPHLLFVDQFENNRGTRRSRGASLSLQFQSSATCDRCVFRNNSNAGDGCVQQCCLPSLLASPRTLLMPCFSSRSLQVVAYLLVAELQLTNSLVLGASGCLVAAMPQPSRKFWHAVVTFLAVVDCRQFRLARRRRVRSVGRAVGVKLAV